VSVVTVTESTVEDTSTLKVSTDAAGVSLVDEEQDANNVAAVNRINNFFIFLFFDLFLKVNNGLIYDKYLKSPNKYLLTGTYLYTYILIYYFFS
jgi:hypothetical protein